MVDMSLGVCTCKTGQDRSPCKHQYLLWVTKLANCLNFVPVSCPELRQQFALVALGRTLATSKYTCLRHMDPVQDLVSSEAEEVSPAQEKDRDINEIQEQVYHN
jgi:hypothetical protein